MSIRPFISKAFAATTASPSRVPSRVIEKNTATSASVRRKMSRFTASSGRQCGQPRSASQSTRPAMPRKAPRARTRPYSASAHSPSTEASAMPGTPSLKPSTNSRLSAMFTRLVTSSSARVARVSCLPMNQPASA